MKTTRQILAGLCLLSAMFLLTMCKEEGNVESISLDQPALSLKIGETATLKATIAPSTSKATIKWASSNSDIATVSSDGVVTAVANGNAQVVASAGGKNVTCEVYVGGITRLSVRPETLMLGIGESETLEAKVTPSKLQSVTTVKWSSEKSSVATVSNKGEVTAVGEGETVIVAKAEGKTSECVVTVVKERIAVTGVTLNKSTLKIMLAEIDSLEATVLPANATTKTVLWSSDKTDIATVDGRGIITAKAIGTAVITATSTENSTKKASCTVTIVPLALKSVAVNPASGCITKIGGTLQLTSVTLPALLPDSMKKVTWSSSDPTLATVSATGLVTGVGKGVVKIRATNTKVKTVYGESEITVAMPPVTSVTIAPATVSLFTAETQTLTATVLPADAGSKTLTWSSSTPAVASVDQAGKITAKKVGTTTITATANNGVKGTCVVTVKPILVTSVTVTPSTLELSANTSETLSLEVLPANAANKSVTWTSSNSSVASVNASGKVTGIADGTATITATAKDGSGKKGSCVVKVKFVKVTSVKFSYAEPLLMNIGDFSKMYAYVLPSNASNQKVTFKVLSSGVISNVDEKITAIGAGSARFVVTTTDGSNLSDTMEVNVDSHKIYTYQYSRKGIYGGNNPDAELYATVGLVTWMGYENNNLYYKEGSDYYKNGTKQFSTSAEHSVMGVYNGAIYTLNTSTKELYKNNTLLYTLSNYNSNSLIYFEKGNFYAGTLVIGTDTRTLTVYKNDKFLKTITYETVAYRSPQMVVKNDIVYLSLYETYEAKTSVFREGTRAYDRTSGEVKCMIVNNSNIYTFMDGACHKNGQKFCDAPEVITRMYEPFVSADGKVYWRSQGIYRNNVKIGYSSIAQDYLLVVD